MSSANRADVASAPSAPAERDQPIVSVRNLAISIRGREVVSDVSFDVRAGECVGLVGESGSGKSVTCRALIGLLPYIGAEIIGGEILLEGTSVTAATEARWRRLRGRTVSLVPQASLAALDPVMRIGRQLVETIRLHDEGAEPNARARELLDLVQISDPSRALKAYPHELSGGMRQRVMIALAVAARPRVLVADEPTTALDVTVQSAILALLDDLRQEAQLALILVSHDLSIIGAMADRVTVMYGGMGVEQGSCDQVLSRPRHPYTRALLDADLVHAAPGQRLVALSGSPPDPSEWPSGCRFALRCPHAAPRCSEEIPPIEEDADRSVACFRWRELSL
jgi:oligopeptide/dipeptide ABC transporter ATP-binding protein